MGDDDIPRQQPNSHNCYVCGLKTAYGLQLVFFDNGEDQVWCDYAIPAHYEGYPGVAHGGVVAAILDEICGRASMIADLNHFMMTAKMEVKYRCPVPLNVELRACGRVTRRRGRLAQARGELRLPDGRLAAEATLTLADLPKRLRSQTSLEELGWRVYD